MGATGREAVDLAMKSQRKAGDPPPEVPGAAIEAYFKPFQILVDGEPGSRPIDALLANLNELYRQLELAAANPAKPSRRSSRWRSRWRACAPTYAAAAAARRHDDKVAKDAAGDANASSIAQIAEAMAQDVTAPCQQIIANRYPFAKSDRDVPLADFARLFAPNGVIDRFFAANLAPLVNLTGKTWTWQPNPNLTRKLSDTTLRQFQQAAEIRDAFFPTGGSVAEHEFRGQAADAERRRADGDAARQRRDGRRPTGRATPPANVAMARRRRRRRLDHDGARHAGPEVQLERTGAWAFFRLIDAGALIQRGNAVSVSFVVGGREVSYQFTSASLNNPLSMPSLRQFKCPNGL